MTQAPTQTSLAERVQYVPMNKIGTVANLRGLVQQQSAGIAAALPKHVTPERLLKTMLTAVNRNPKLLECTQSSVMETISRAAELGLDLSGTLGEAYPVPFNNKVGDNWVSQCQLIIGYRGLAKLARQSGEVSTISSDVVCEHDTFIFRKGSGACCEFTPNLRGDRGEVYGAFAHVQFKDGTQQFDFMNVNDIEKVRRRSKSGSDKQGKAIGAWSSDWEEMAKKTVFRRLAKWLPLSAEKFVQALEHDSAEYDVQEIVEGAPPAKGSAALLDKLKGEKAAPLPQDEPVIGTTPEGGQEPTDDPQANPVNWDAIQSRYFTSNGKLRGETDDKMIARFEKWKAAQAGDAGTEQEAWDRCDLSLAEMEASK